MNYRETAHFFLPFAFCLGSVQENPVFCKLFKTQSSKIKNPSSSLKLKNAKAKSWKLEGRSYKLKARRQKLEAKS